MKVVNDFRMRNEIGVEKALFEKWEMQFETVFKLENDVSRLDEIDFDLAMSYDIVSFITLGLGYRLELNKDNDNIYQQRNRLHGDMRITMQRRLFELQWRFRYQTLDDEDLAYLTTHRAENIIRNRLEVEYNISGSELAPFISAEHYGTLNDNREFGIKMRYMAGLAHGIGNHHDIELYYRINRELNHHLPYTYHYLGVGYEFSF